MARQTSGAIVEHTGLDGRTYRALRFTAAGKRRYASLGPVSRGDAESELRHVLADLERGTWRPRKEVEATAEPEPVPTFHEFAERWWLRNERQLAENTQADYRWRLERHLLPFFSDYRLDRITFDLVERYIAVKLGEDEPLAPRSVNMTLTLMAAILEGAVERELIARNPAKGKRRRVRERAPRRTYLDTSEQIEALLAAAGELDSEARHDRRHVSRRAILATLTFAGLRIGELCALRWRDVDLKTGWLHVGESKTDAGRRRVKIRGTLLDQLAVVQEHARHGKASDYVFATRTGGRQSRENMRSRVLAPAVELASERLVEAGSSPLPDGLTPHSLRRTFASVLYALGEDPGVVMDEMGHTDPALALRVYRQTMRRGDDEKARLRALVEGTEVAVGGSRSVETAGPLVEQNAA